MQVIYILDNDNNLKSDLQKKFSNDKKVRIKKVNPENLEEALKNIPSLIIINEDNIEGDILELCDKIKLNEDNAITPVIVVSSNVDRDHKMEILMARVTYFIKNPVDIDMLYVTIKNIISLLFINRKVSPLTSLPGNVQIQAEMKKRLVNKDYFVMLYLDLDNFKAYNDIYGFSNGDEVIKFTARTIVNNVHKEEDDNNFVGHIGGDDFIAIIEDENFENICQDIIAEFDLRNYKIF